MASSLNSKGFTLVEVLVVLLIFSIMLSLISFSTGMFTNKEIKVTNLQQSLHLKMQMLQQKALVNQSVYRVAFFDRQYAIQRYSMEKEAWITLESPRNLKPQTIPDDIDFIYHISNVTQSAEILFQPSGEITPFTIVISSGDIKRTLSGTQEGELLEGKGKTADEG